MENAAVAALTPEGRTMTEATDNGEQAAEHEHVYGEWQYQFAPDWWERRCTVEGCSWRQGSSDDPANQSSLGRAMSRLVGIDTPPSNARKGAE
jgi:hypothetical protein